MVTLLINILTALLGLVYSFLVLFFRSGWLKLPYSGPPATKPYTRVTILIAARNEEDKLALTIEDILAQDYPKELVDLIVIDDHSTDRTAAIISSYANQNVTLVRLNEDQPLNSYKKKAIAEGIRIAKGSLIVTTDADCRMEKQWLATIVAMYEQKGLKLISSPVGYFEERSMFEEMQSLEFLYLIGLGASTIGNKMSSTCNGANLAYSKDVFLEVGGFAGIDDVASGDDELLLHKIASKYPDGIGFCKSKQAMVYTHAKHSLTAFINQRKRWASKSTKYKNKPFVVLSVAIWLFNLGFLVSMTLGFFSVQAFWFALLILVMKFGAEVAFLYPVTRFARRTKLLWYLPLITVLHPVYMVYIGIAGNAGKYRWKGRMVR